MNEFEVVVVGSDINAYYMCRCCYEAYQKKAHLIGKEEQAFTQYSDIIEYEGYYKDLWEPDCFLKVLQAFKDKYPNQKLLLIGTNDHYVRLMIENQEYLSKYYIFPKFSLDLLDSLLRKDIFYSKYADSCLPFPKTEIYDCENPIPLRNTYTYPLILKPGDGVEYHKHDFLGAAKVYKIRSFENLQNVVQMIQKSGYKGKLIFQEFIPGEDADLYDVMVYCDRNSELKLMSFAQIGLQEHTQTGIGNCTVLVNGFYEKGNPHEVKEEIAAFLKSIQYQGFAEFDLKFDKRTGTYKVFEMNPRQARCAYYLAACGHNLVKYLVDDLIFHKNLKNVELIDPMVMSFVPMGIIKKYVKSEALKLEIKKLKKQGKIVNPLKCKLDKNKKRKLWLFLRSINYYKKYKNNEW